MKWFVKCLGKILNVSLPIPFDRKGGYYSSSLFIQHGVAILEDLLITLADGTASMYLELISVNSSLSNEMNNLGLSLCTLSTRALQRLRNEVLLPFSFLIFSPFGSSYFFSCLSLKLGTVCITKIAHNVHISGYVWLNEDLLLWNSLLSFPIHAKASSMKHNICVLLWMLYKYTYSAENFAHCSL